MKRFLFPLALVSLLACSSDKEVDGNALMSNDFESVAGWVPENPSLTTEKAHSGRYSIKVDPGTEFSLTYNTILGKLSNKRLKGVKLEAWAYMPSPQSIARLGLVIQGADGKEMLGEGIDLATQVKKQNEWTKITKDITFPANAEYNNKMLIYLWRGSASAPAYVDDITLTPIE